MTDERPRDRFLDDCPRGRPTRLSTTCLLTRHGSAPPLSTASWWPGRRHVDAERRRRDDLWSRGFTRRRFLAGGMAGVAGLGAQLATARASYGVAPGTGTLVVVFLRGGMDGLSVLVPADDPHLPTARPGISVPAGALLPLTRGFGLHPALTPLHNLWKVGAFTAVPAVSTPDISSHFQAQDCLERGGSGTGTNEGWLDRVLDTLGPARPSGPWARTPPCPERWPATSGPWRSTGSSASGSGRGGGPSADVRGDRALYTGVDHLIAQDTTTTLEALDIARFVVAADLQPAAPYPEGEFAARLADVARLIKAGVGLRVALRRRGLGHAHQPGNGRVGRHDPPAHAARRDLGALATDLGDRLAGDGGGLDRVRPPCPAERQRRHRPRARRSGAADRRWPGCRHGPGARHGLAPEGLDRGDVPG